MPLQQARDTVLQAARRQGHGARPRGPGHLVGRLVLHQPGACRDRGLGRSCGARRRRTGRRDDGTVKIPAAWLIEHAGFPKGYAGAGVAISSKHTLALTNRGAGSTAALLDLARTIRDGVRDRFGIELHPEPVLVNCTL